MRKFNLLLLIISFTSIVISMNSCRDSENIATLELKLNPTFGGVPINLFEPVTDENEQNILLIDKLYFYISDLTLNDVPAEGEILLIDLEDAALSKGITKAKPGNYTSITIGLGVNEKMNHSAPASYENNHPLGSDHTDRHWTWESGYIFYKIEGNFSTNDDGVLDGNFLFHIGRDELFRTITIDKTFELVENCATEVVLNIDFEKLFFTEDGINLKTENTTQADIKQEELNKKFINRLIESIE